MDLWQLNIFCKVVQHKSFSQAGRAIHLSQPTISSHIQALEQHFGCRLIDRLAKEALPTPAGTILFRYAKRLLALREETEAAMAQYQGNVRGRLRVGASTIPGGYLLPRLIGGFTCRYPEVTVSLEIADSGEIIRRVLAGDLELAIVGAETHDRNAVQQPLIEDELCLVVPAGHRWADRRTVPLARLAAEPFIVREHGSGTLAALQAKLQQAGTPLRGLNIVAEMGSTTAVIQAIKAGMGVSILSPIAVREELAAGTLNALAVKGLNFKRAFFLTRHRHRSASPLGNAFVRYLQESIESLKSEANR